MPRGCGKRASDSNDHSVVDLFAYVVYRDDGFANLIDPNGLGFAIIVDFILVLAAMSHWYKYVSIQQIVGFRLI